MALVLLLCGILWEYIPSGGIRLLLLTSGILIFLLADRRQKKRQSDFANEICDTVDALMNGSAPENYQPYEDSQVSKVQGKLLQYYDRMQEGKRQSEQDKQMIQELQRCQADFREMLVLLLRQIFISIHRQLTREDHLNNDFMDKEMELAIEYFDEHYPEDIRVENYASSRGMSVSWFIRSFKQYTKTTPRQYIMNIRMMNAQILLENTNYNITEIGAIVGYDNPLYFSRIFRKQKGVSPSAYRRQRMNTGNLDGIV